MVVHRLDLRITHGLRAQLNSRTQLKTKRKLITIKLRNKETIVIKKLKLLLEKAIQSQRRQNLLKVQISIWLKRIVKVVKP